LLLLLLQLHLQQLLFLQLLLRGQELLFLWLSFGCNRRCGGGGGGNFTLALVQLPVGDVLQLLGLVQLLMQLLSLLEEVLLGEQLLSCLSDLVALRHCDGLHSYSCLLLLLLMLLGEHLQLLGLLKLLLQLLGLLNEFSLSELLTIL
jgi:hypothetical protein